ncbi:hypothetical protein NDU88_002231 [Pleurodeles waltl]|uniref:Uncharacterized protein n=1 Tax=Pleurodeles waltl TaxID=8319 RepID=A0AAV7UBR1_PLEWA|nr:hypothetical protein NDU88_002231 [Pleurodeles waltl]
MGAVWRFAASPALRWVRGERLAWRASPRSERGRREPLASRLRARPLRTRSCAFPHRMGIGTGLSLEGARLAPGMPETVRPGRVCRRGHG